MLPIEDDYSWFCLRIIPEPTIRELQKHILCIELNYMNFQLFILSKDELSGVKSHCTTTWKYSKNPLSGICFFVLEITNWLLVTFATGHCYLSIEQPHTGCVTYIGAELWKYLMVHMGDIEYLDPCGLKSIPLMWKGPDLCSNYMIQIEVLFCHTLRCSSVAN